MRILSANETQKLEKQINKSVETNKKIDVQGSKLNSIIDDKIVQARRLSYIEAVIILFSIGCGVSYISIANEIDVHY